MKKQGDLADPTDAELRKEAEELLRICEETNEPIFETKEPISASAEVPDETIEVKTETDALPRIEKHTEIQSLKCILTHGERRECGERMARALNVKAEVVGVLKSVNDQYKAEISKAEAEMAGEASKINSGYEFRPVKIQVEFDYQRGTVTKIRTDTFEVIEDRLMSDYEAQRKIRFSG